MQWKSFNKMIHGSDRPYPQEERLKDKQIELEKVYAARMRLQKASDQADALEGIREIVANLLGSEEVALFRLDPKHAAFWLYWSFGIDPNKHVVLDILIEPSLAEVISGKIWLRKAGESLLSIDTRVSALVPIIVDNTTAAVLVIFNTFPQKAGLMLFRKKDQPMDSKHDATRFNPATLPQDYLPKVSGEVEEGYTKHYLMPGKVLVFQGSHAITTIVGSGVAVCLWDANSSIGGANHFLTPEGPENEQDKTRSGEVANETLLKDLIALGADPAKLQAKIFGGSQPAVSFGNTTECLGDRNVQLAVRFLRLKGIPIKEQQTGEKSGRKLIFHTDNGKTWSQQL